jgi:hypothetical protein
MLAPFDALETAMSRRVRAHRAEIHPSVPIRLDIEMTECDVDVTTRAM